MQGRNGVKENGLSKNKKGSRVTCPAVSHSCRRTVLSSRYIVFDKKSIPIVAYSEQLRRDVVKWFVCVCPSRGIRSVEV